MASPGNPRSKMAEMILPAQGDGFETKDRGLLSQLNSGLINILIVDAEVGASIFLISGQI